MSANRRRGAWGWVILGLGSWTAAGAIVSSGLPLQAATPALVGDWALELPTGEAGWLAVRETEQGLAADLMWAVGSPRPIDDLHVSGDTLRFNRRLRRPLAPPEEPAANYRVTARAAGDELHFELDAVTEGTVAPRAPREFRGRRMPPLPPRPDLSKVRFAPRIALFNGRDLAGWRITGPGQKNGWSVRDGELVNQTPKTDFGSYGEYANLCTEAEFDDFRLTVEFLVPPRGNSGVYLRGQCEVQVVDRDSPMQGISGPGALFGRIVPTENAGLPGGQWQRYEITYVDRHVTVVLNGRTVIDNRPVAGPTGGAMSADVTRPGPIMLQGDHTAVSYRRVEIEPVIGQGAAD